MTRSIHARTARRSLALAAIAAFGCSSAEDAPSPSASPGGVDATVAVDATFSAGGTDPHATGGAGGGGGAGAGGTQFTAGGAGAAAGGAPFTTGGAGPGAGGAPFTTGGGGAGAGGAPFTGGSPSTTGGAGSDDAGSDADSGESPVPDSGLAPTDASTPDVIIAESGASMDGGGLATDARADASDADAEPDQGGGCDCDDGNPCTMDSCAVEGGCVHVPRPDGFVCTNDSNPCTMDACVAGVCNTPFPGDIVMCRSASCMDGPTESVATLYAYCDGTPTCPEPVTVSCQGMYCSPTQTSCAAFCFDTSECRPGYHCAGPGPVWEPLWACSPD